MTSENIIYEIKSQLESGEKTELEIINSISYTYSIESIKFALKLMESEGDIWMQGGKYAIK